MAAKTQESGKESDFRWLNGFTESTGLNSKYSKPYLTLFLNHFLHQTFNNNAFQSSVN